MAAGNLFGGNRTVALHCSRHLSNVIFIFIHRRKVFNLAGRHAVHNLDIRRFQEAVIIDMRITCHRYDKTDIRPFRRFNRAHPSVVSIVNVADFKTGAVTGKTAGPQRIQTALMGKLRERINLIHELRKLTCPEKLFDGSNNRLYGNKLLRLNRFNFF